MSSHAKMSTFSPLQSATENAGWNVDQTLQGLFGNAALIEMMKAKQAPTQVEETPEPNIPLSHVIYEQLAHRASYVEFPVDIGGSGERRTDISGAAVGRWEVEDSRFPGTAQREADTYAQGVKELIGKLGYMPVQVVDNALTGFQAVLFVPTVDGVNIANSHAYSDQKWSEDLKPVVAFRGSQDARSWADDMNPEGVGAYQFRMNEASIVKLLAQGQQGGVLPDVTGHSLGGALAELAGAHFGGMVNEVVSFQAPAVNEEDAALAKKNGTPSTHYRVEGDVVPLAGEQHTPGTARLFHHSDTDVGYNQADEKDGVVDRGDATGNAHTVYPLQDRNTAQGNAGKPYLPALQSYEAKNHEHREETPTVTTLQDGPSWLKPYGEAIQQSRTARGALMGYNDYLNAPIVRLSEQLRPLVAQAAKPDADIAALTEQIRNTALNAEDRVIREARDDYFGKTVSMREQYMVGPVENMLAEGWPIRRDQLIEQTIELMELEIGLSDWFQDHKRVRGSVNRLDSLK